MIIIKVTKMSAGWAHRVVRTINNHDDNHHDVSIIIIIMVTDHNKIAGWTHRVVRTRHSYSFCNWFPVQVDLFKMKKKCCFLPQLTILSSINYFVLN